MTQLKEYEGRTIDEAIEKACQSLNVPRERLNIEIISEGSTGFFGFGSKKARIGASLLVFEMPPTAPVSGTKGNGELDIVSTEDTSEEVAGQSETPVESGTETIGDRAKEILEGILTHMSMEASVTLEEGEDRVNLNIHGDGGGLLIGKRGKNLDALQYIVNKASNRLTDSRKMIVIDTEGYRKRREDSLVALAKELGEKARRTQKPITVSHMNAHNRRIIHMALQNEEGLTTKSRGEGEFRKIIILPDRK
ncbi:MAG: RNA-binding cell elongation regulator Jag/EloR [Syntrophales bacterium]|jgi:spoIIIJ-associated protein|nr:RNA-binding cell elongation regulator Jag/EloR [Syntrophales bacterium]